MSITKDQQQALDNVLVPREQRLRIRKYPPFEEEVLPFIRKLGHTRDIKLLIDVKIDTLHQPWRTFGTIFNKCLSEKESDAYKTYYAFASGKKIPKPKYVWPSTKEKTVQAPKTSPDEQIFWKSSDDKDDDEVSESKYDEDNADDEDDDDQDDDSEQTKLNNDGDDFVHPKFSTHDKEERQDEEDKEEACFNQRVHTPSYYESTDDEAYDEVTQSVNVKEENLDEEKINEEGDVNEMYNDVNINLERRDTEMKDAP
uniref:Uncharacterized protein n=1 Tax=Tanacetum cinerariifolium TaxID=118510 RepID=A0A6L2MXQ1_TANCI|nr:hypothetical protein [Tanacetum cinerariifolium]